MAMHICMFKKGVIHAQVRSAARVVQRYALGGLRQFPGVCGKPVLHPLAHGHSGGAGSGAGFIGHYKCPAHRVWARIFEARGWAGKKENAGAKMFANKILFLASLVSVVAYALGSDIWRIPCIVLMVFATLEWAFSFCAACSVYGLWYRVFPPRMG